jgi:ubiquinone/menaquinone biosynthesis C-methylase UbiE
MKERGATMLSIENVYDQWADYYDLADIDRTEYVRFYSSLLGPDVSSVLELGCGTGTIAAALVQRAHSLPQGQTLRVFGIDRSARMLTIARAKCPRVRWIKGDIRRLPTRGGFDLVVCCFNTLQLLLTDADLKEALLEARCALNSGGRLAFDIYQPNIDYLQSHVAERSVRSMSLKNGVRLELREKTHYLAESRILAVHWRLLDVTATPPRTVSRITHHLRQYFREDIRHVLQQTGFVIHEWFGDFQRSRFDDTSKKQVLICGAR